jgi:signal transduction histidine kinase
MPSGIGFGYYVRFRGESYRELYHENPTFQVFVGADLTSYYRGLKLLKLKILGGAFSLFLIGVIVGSIFVSRLIRPLDTIEKVSSKIASGKLRERIPVEAGGGARELESLTENLNHTFGKLEESFHRQMRFTADASHELRTPLTALLSQIEYGLKRERQPEEYQKVLEVCQRSSERIQRITKQLIELSRYDSGRVEMDYEEVSLEPLMIALAEELEPYVRSLGHQLHTEIMPGDLICDPFRIDQVITNLINNAVQHNDQPINITLRAEIKGDECWIEVVDTGKGILKENLESVFGRFFQESASRANENGRANVGLGLAISEAIVKEHGGRIEVESSPGVRASFRIVLPCHAGSR